MKRYIGPERRRSTPEVREDYRRENGLPAPELTPASWGAAALLYLSMLPKPLLVLATLTLSVFAGQQGVAWVRGVDSSLVKHTSQMDQGNARLGKVEVLASTTAQHVEQVGGEVQDLRGELREMRRDQLTYYRWMAETLGDQGKAREVDKRLKSIEEQPR